MKYEFILTLRHEHSLVTLCRVFRISRSAFYTWLKNASARRDKDRELLEQIEAVHERHRGHSGALKTWRVLKDAGVECGKHRVARVRQQHGIVAKRRLRFIVTTKSKPSLRHAENLLGRKFVQPRPNLAWVGDVTFIPTREGHLYLAVLIDLHSRMVVGWSVSARNDVLLIAEALKMATQSRRPAAGLIHHSDRGAPYASRTYQHHLEKEGMVASMSAKGNCWDNAVAESFFATLEFELLEGKPIRSRAIARDKLGEFIEIYYNRQRTHQTLDYKTPIQMEDVA